MGVEIDFALHNPFADTWWVLLKDCRCAHLIFTSLWDVNPDVHCSTVIRAGSLPVGVSYELYYDKIVHIYGIFWPRWIPYVWVS